MSLSWATRQPDGIPERQSEDTGFGSGTLRATNDLAAAFLAENLSHLKLAPLTLDAVNAAVARGEVCERTAGEPALRSAEHVLGGALSDAELRHSVDGDHDALIVVFGVGLGHTARALRALTDAPIVIFEPDPSVLRALLELGPSDLSDFDIVCTTHDLTQIWSTVFSGRRSAALVPTVPKVERLILMTKIRCLLGVYSWPPL